MIQSAGKTAKLKIADKQFDRDLRAALGNVEMRRILWWVMESPEMADVHGIPMETNASVYFSNGRKFVGMVLRQTIDLVDPQALLLMQQEAKNLEKINVSGNLLVDGKILPDEIERSMS